MALKRYRDIFITNADGYRRKTTSMGYTRRLFHFIDYAVVTVQMILCMTREILLKIKPNNMVFMLNVCGLFCISIGWDNGLSPIRCQAIISTNAGLIRTIEHACLYFDIQMCMWSVIVSCFNVWYLMLIIRLFKLRVYYNFPHVNIYLTPCNPKRLSAWLALRGLGVVI